MNRWTALALLAIIAAALAWRVTDLGARPVHNDEAVNALKLRDLWKQRQYTYDPHEFHGPTLYYSALPFLSLGSARQFGDVTEAQLRWVTVVFGVGLIALLPLLSDGLGRRAIVWAGILTAISTAMVFYSRYFIHETVLVFFTMLTFAAAWRYYKERRAGWALLGGAGVGLMWATKETFVIVIAAMVAAIWATAFWRGWRSLKSSPSRRRRSSIQERVVGKVVPLDEDLVTPADVALRAKWKWLHLGLAAGAAIIVWALLFSSFFTHSSGPVDSFRTYQPWLHRAGGASEHIHSGTFYFERLFFFKRPGGTFWTEGLILLLAVVGGVSALRDSRRPLPQFLFFYTVFLTTAYSVIPYKTPWCALGFLHAMILLAGVGLETLFTAVRYPALRVMTLAAVSAGLIHVGWQSWLASHFHTAERTNPWTYSQTSPDLLNLVKRVETLAALHPDGREMVVHVIAPQHDYGPLIWYLRRFGNVGWWDHLPTNPPGTVTIVDAALDVRLDEKATPLFMSGLFELRPGKFLELYVDPELWRLYIAEASETRQTD